MQSEKQPASRVFDARTFFKRWPGFYYFIATVFGPMMMRGLSARAFLSRYPQRGKTLNIGSGPRILGTEVTNIDIHPYPGVSITASADSIPLPSESIARIISDTVLEHIANPAPAVAEMHRLLEKGGLAYVSIPFLYPYHSSPHDYQRWTIEGVRVLFSKFEIVELGVRAGPFSALTAYLCHLFGVIFSFGYAPLESILVNAFMFIFFPIKFLDLIFNYWPKADRVSALLYCVVRKK
jgi:SAM-dependent methyltransferase